MNKGHPRERLHMAFIDKQSLFGGCVVLIKEGLLNLKCGLYLQGGLYSDMAFNTGLTVYILWLFYQIIMEN